MANNNSKTNSWNKFTEKFFNTHGFSTRRKFYNSIWSILFGFIIMIVVLSFFGVNSFEVIIAFFTSSFSEREFVPTLIAYIFAALSISLCFKAGIFNIGVPGQMIASGFITYVMLKNNPSELSIFLSIVLSIVLSIIISLILGILKSYLGINEVVSSIMLNWIIFFISLSFIKSNSDFFPLTSSRNDVQALENIPKFFDPEVWYSSGWIWILITLSLFAILMVWIIIKFTKFGFKIKMIGLSQSASDYSGTNKKHLTLIVLAISGLLSGLAGFVYFLGVKKCSMQALSDAGPIAIGFNAIAVSLIVFDNPIAIFFSSFLFSIITVGSASPEIQLRFDNSFPKEMSEVISGIFVYCAALAFIFSKFLPYIWIRNFIILVRDKEYRKKYWKNYFEFFNFHFSWFNEKKQLFSLWIKHHKKWKEIERQIKLKEKNEEKKLSSNKKFIFANLTNDQQIEYLNYLALLKKEKDLLLSKSSYFDKELIKSKRIERYHTWKQNYHDFKLNIINNYLNIEEEKLIDSTNEIIAKEKQREAEKKANLKGGK